METAPSDTLRPAAAPATRRLWLAALLAAALALRLTWGFMQPAGDEALAQVPAQRQFLDTARSILNGEGVRFFDARFGNHVHAFHTPGYPLMLTVCGAGVRVARVVQAVIDTSTVLAVCLLARRFAGGPAVWPLAAGGLVALNPWLVRFSALLLPETLFTAMLCWGMLLLLSHRPTPVPPSWRATLRWLLGGLVLALAALVKPGAAGLPVLLGLSAVFVNRRRGTAYEPYEGAAAGTTPALPYHPRWPLPAGTTMLLLTLVVMAPWAYRNRQVVGRWVWTTTSTGFSAYEAASVDESGEPEPAFPESMQQLRSMNEADRSVYLWNLAAERFQERRARLLFRAPAKAWRMWSPHLADVDDSKGGDVGDALDGGRFGRIAAWAYVLPFQVAVFLGAVKGGLPRSAKLFLLLPAIYFTPVHLLCGSAARDRTPVEPPMAVLAASVLGLPAAAWKRAS